MELKRNKTQEQKENFFFFLIVFFKRGHLLKNLAPFCHSSRYHDRFETRLDSAIVKLPSLSYKTRKVFESQTNKLFKTLHLFLEI